MFLFGVEVVASLDEFIIAFFDVSEVLYGLSLVFWRCGVINGVDVVWEPWIVCGDSPSVDRKG